MVLPFLSWPALLFLVMLAIYIGDDRTPLHYRYAHTAFHTSEVCPLLCSSARRHLLLQAASLTAAGSYEHSRTARSQPILCDLSVRARRVRCLGHSFLSQAIPLQRPVTYCTAHVCLPVQSHGSPVLLGNSQWAHQLDVPYHAQTF